MKQAAASLVLSPARTQFSYHFGVSIPEAVAQEVADRLVRLRQERWKHTFKKINVDWEDPQHYHVMVAYLGSPRAAPMWKAAVARRALADFPPFEMWFTGDWAKMGKRTERKVAVAYLEEGGALSELQDYLLHGWRVAHARQRMLSKRRNMLNAECAGLMGGGAVEVDDSEPEEQRDSHARDDSAMGVLPRMTVARRAAEWPRDFGWGRGSLSEVKPFMIDSVQLYASFTEERSETGKRRAYEVVDSIALRS